MENTTERIIAEYEKIAFAELGGEYKVSDKLRALAALWEIHSGQPLCSAAEKLVIKTEYI